MMNNKLKAYFPIVFTDAGIKIYSSDEHFLKAEFPILVNDDGNMICSRALIENRCFDLSYR